MCDVLDILRRQALVDRQAEDALRLALKEEMTRDPDVFLMGEGIGERGGSYKVTDGLFKEFGADRVMDTPLSEAFAGFSFFLRGWPIALW